MDDALLVVLIVVPLIAFAVAIVVRERRVAAAPASERSAVAS